MIFTFVGIVEKNDVEFAPETVTRLYHEITDWLADNLDSNSFSLTASDWILWKFPFTQKSFPEYILIKNEQDALAFRLRFRI